MNARADSDHSSAAGLSENGPAGTLTRASDPFFRSVVEAANEGIWIIDLEARTIFANERMAAMLGTTPDAMIGISPFEFLFEEDQARARDVMSSNFRGAPVEFEIRFRRTDGSEIPVLAGSAPLREDGRITGSVATFSDLTERKAAEQALRASESEAREAATLFLQLLESSSDAIWLRDAEGRFQIVNPVAARVLGGTTESLVGRPMTEVWGESFAAVLRAQTKDLFERGESATIEEEVADKGRGAPTIFLSNKVPLYNPDGSPLGILGISRDITELKQVERELRDNQARLAQQVEELQAAQQREHLLAREVDHRAKNLLAVVQSVVQLSRASDVDELKEGLTGRIQSLARAHSLLADSRWEGVDLAQLVAEELAPFAGGGSSQVTQAGPALTLRPSAAQSLALVLHELATNALKYGALSVPEGRLSLEWRCAGEGAGQVLEIDWIESGGAAVSAPDESGFGSRLITTSVERQLRGEVHRQWLAEGLRCSLRIPAAHAVIARAGGPAG